MLKEMVSSTNSSLALTSSSVSSFATTSKKTSKAGFSKLGKQISSIATHSRAESKAITLQIEVSWTFQIPVLMSFTIFIYDTHENENENVHFWHRIVFSGEECFSECAFLDDPLPSVQSYHRAIARLRFKSSLPWNNRGLQSTQFSMESVETLAKRNPPLTKRYVAIHYLIPSEIKQENCSMC